MVILGGLEVVAAGYLYHKHQENKKNKARLQEEAAALEEQQYRIFPDDKRRHRRSHSRGRHSGERRSSRERTHPHDRRHSNDRYERKQRRENSMPAQVTQQGRTRPQHPGMNVPSALDPQQMRPQAPPSMAQQMHPQAPPSIPPPQYDPSTAPPQQYQDVKYGWTDAPVQQPQPPQDSRFPPTGWPAHWTQSQTNLQAPDQRGDMSRERRERTPEPSPHVRFAVPTSPPPSYGA